MSDGPAASASRRVAVHATVLLALVLSVFGRALDNGFVYDDHELVEDNAVVRTLDPLRHLEQPFWGGADSIQDYYRPVVTISLALDRALYGSRPWGYHLTNLLLHWLNVLMLFLLLRGHGGTRLGYAGAVLFAVHPVQSEAVVWVLGRTDLLATLFVLASLVLYSMLDGRLSRRQIGYVALLGLSAFAALLSKEVAIVLPVLLVGLELARSRSSRGATTRLALGAATVGAVSVGYLYLRHTVLGGILNADVPAGLEQALPFHGASLAVRSMTAVNVAGRYLTLLFFPRVLSADYRSSVPLVSSLWSADFLAPLTAVLAFVAATIWLCRRRSVAVFGALTLGASYLLVSNILFPVPVIMAERLLYLPLVGVSTLFGAVVDSSAAAAGPRTRRAVVAAAAVLLAGLGLRSFVRTPEWKDDLTLFRATVETTPRSAVAWRGLGQALMRGGRHEAALEAFRRSERLAADRRLPLRSRAAALRELGRLDEARTVLRQLVAEYPRSQRGWVELVQVSTWWADQLASRGRAPEAREIRTEIVEEIARQAGPAMEAAAPGVSGVFHSRLALNLSELGRSAEAAAMYDHAIASLERELSAAGASDPGPSRKILAVVLAESASLELRAGRLERAAARLERAAEAHRGSGDAMSAASAELRASRVRLRQHRVGEARAALGRAASVVGGEERLFGALPGELLAVAEEALQSGHARMARPIYERLVSVEPIEPRALHGRGRARLLTGDLTGAEADLRRALTEVGDATVAAAVWTDLARVATARGEAAEARRRLEQALRKDPEHAEARELLRRLGP